jgi:putative transposase
MLKAHKIRLNPTKEQATYFYKACGTARHAYNWAVAKWREWVGKKPSAMQLKKLYHAEKPEWAYEVTKCAPEGAFFDFGAALKNMYEGRAGEPQFKSKKRGHFSFYLANDKFDVSGFFIKVPKLGLVNMAEKLRWKGKILGATITREADFWYVSITLELADEPKQPPNGQCGLDVGILRLATLSDGTTFENARPLKSSQSRLAKLQQRFAKKQKGSKNWLKLKSKIGRLHKRIRDTRNDVLHKLTTKVARQYGFVAVEDLNIEGLLKNHQLAQALSDAALSKLKILLTNKVQATGGGLVAVDRFFPSSKTCSGCGHKRAELSLVERVFSCSQCGVALDRDLNAAINLLKEGLRIASEYPLSGTGLDGHEKTLTGLQS